ncbi:hypothetical protein XfCFBP8078_01565 [Xylella fastidiosa subsp. multiplex]|nr:hypothetical protein P303_00305 [Xylella fastidiosa MUL0034]RWA38576.1 hypothetical protein XfCFBP8078_01565 [Xylella fastidiosa subsp. multiplex]TNV97172.1 hypothetical protein C5H22_02280 [Xylella fastidiosa]
MQALQRCFAFEMHNQITITFGDTIDVLDHQNVLLLHIRKQACILIDGFIGHHRAFHILMRMSGNR